MTSIHLKDYDTFSRQLLIYETPEDKPEFFSSSLWELGRKYEIGEKIGTGSNAYVYEIIGTNKVIKISSNFTEYYVNKQIKDGDYDNLAPVYECGLIMDSNDIEVGSYTVLDYLTTASNSEDFKNMVDFFVKQTIIFYDFKKKEMLFNYNNFQELNIFFNDNIADEFYDSLSNTYGANELKDMCVQIANATDELRKLKSIFVDYHAGNIGLLPETGRIVLFDINHYIEPYNSSGVALFDTKHYKGCYNRVKNTNLEVEF